VGTLSGGAHPGGLNGQDAYSGQLVVVDEVETRADRRGLRDLEAGGGVCPTLNAFDNATESRATVLAFDSKQDGSDDSETSPTLLAMPHDASHANGGGQVAVAIMGDHTHALTHEGHDASEDGTGRGTPIVALPHAFYSTGGSHGVNMTPDLSPPLKVGSGLDIASPPAVSLQPGGVRRLTPLECERLMGLPDDWTAYDADGKPQADSNRYKQCGNAVVVPVAEWIGYLLKENA
jgi:DNA (cytosine-5)-methyltransferase 1